MSDDVLNPLVTEEAQRFLNELQQSPYAPRFNHAAGDRIEEHDLAQLKKFRERLASSPIMSEPSDELKERVGNWLKHVPLFRKRARGSIGDWISIPTMSRQELAERPELLVPDDAELDRLIIFRTAGTTGHPLLVPHHPQATAAYQILIEQALKSCGISPRFELGRMGCYLIGAQKNTVTYPTVLSIWNQAGFAKLNLNSADWRSPNDRGRYLEQFPPEILTGDPISFATLMELEVKIQPRALISTAVAMLPGLKSRLEAHFKAPVIDWYSLTETGPLGFIKPGETAYSILPHDVFIEVLDEKNEPVAEGEIGEITVTGGRNPFVPLLRYRTGDFGRRKGNQLVDLEGRKPVRFRSLDNKLVNTVDIGRVLRDYPIIQHIFRQRADLSCEVTLRPFVSTGVFPKEKLAHELSDLFQGAPVQVTIDYELGDRLPGGKVMPYLSEVHFEE